MMFESSGTIECPFGNPPKNRTRPLTAASSMARIWADGTGQAVIITSAPSESLTRMSSERGGVIGALATAGVIAGANVPMPLGAMLTGPVAAWTIRNVDRFTATRARAGFEMLVNNFPSA